MRSKSPELMSEIKKYIEDYYLQNRQSPSTTKIAEAVGIARGTAYKYLVEMAEKNMIEYDGQEIRTNVIRKYSGEQTQTPIVGSTPCGSPQYEEENSGQNYFGGMKMKKKLLGKNPELVLYKKR